MYVMNGQQTGTRNTVDWPAIGEPAPEDLTEAEVKKLLASGLIKVVDDAKPNEEHAVDQEPIETATVKSGRGRAKAAAQGVQEPTPAPSTTPEGENHGNAAQADGDAAPANTPAQADGDAAPANTPAEG